MTLGESALGVVRVSGWAAAAAIAFGVFTQGSASSVHAADRQIVIEGVTFDSGHRRLYAPVRKIGDALGLEVRWDGDARQLWLDDTRLADDHVRRLPDGTRLVAVRAFEDWGASVTWDEEAGAASIIREDRHVRVNRGEKFVAVNLQAQRMRAWQGGLKVLDTRISSGRPGMDTPKGRFRAGPLKKRLLISRKYGNARMPWSVQVRGDVVIHGFPSVPPRAASHGCVRVPLAGANPARWFYRWVEHGTPIRIAEEWPDVGADRQGNGLRDAIIVSDAAGPGEAHDDADLEDSGTVAAQADSEVTSGALSGASAAAPPPRR